MINAKLILSIDTATDETSAAVTEETCVLSNVIWSQASLHAKWGGVVPSLAQRAHEERIDWAINKAMLNAKCQMAKIDAVAVTAGPGLAIALGVGIDRAKKLAKKYKKPLVAVNHLEGHILSPLAQASSVQRIANSSLQTKRSTLSSIRYPALGLVVSGGNTILVKINEIGKYETLAATVDDALGEALDKAARMLGLGYPGGPVLEKMTHSSRFAPSGQARHNPYSLPIPIVGQEKRRIFTYSGLKTAFLRLVESEKPLTKEKIYNLAACFQNVAFEHLIRVSSFVIGHLSFGISDLTVGGGVSANVELRKRLRKLGREFGISVNFPYSKKLMTDNAAMIGVAAYFKAKRDEFVNPDKIDRDARAKVDEKFSFEM